MITPLLRARSGTKVMPVMANTRLAPRYSRRPYGVSGLRGLRGLRGLGDATGQLTRPGPDGGTEIVDASGNVLYSEAEVAADPSLLTAISSTNVCPGGLMPTWFPGGESVCAGTETVAGSNIAGPQYNLPVDNVCTPGNWCFTGSSMTDPASFTWTGGGTPTSPNPATIYSAQPLPSVYTTQQTQAQTLAIQDAIARGITPPPVVTNPNVSNVINPPTGGSPVSKTAIANASNQSGNQNMNAGAAAGAQAQSQTTPTCTSIASFLAGDNPNAPVVPIGGCFGPFDLATWGIMGAGALLLFMTLGRK